MERRRGWQRWPWRTAGLGLILILAVDIVGTPGVDSPWLQGDEYIFIAHNPDVTGVGLSDRSIWSRLGRIFRLPPQEDLYQPLPILSYAIEWSIWGPSPEAVRRHDVWLHALNALLLWWLLWTLLGRWDVIPDANLRLLWSWTLALVWALHPLLVSAWAADMGRTHLLAATFALLALRAHLDALPGRWGRFALAVVLLVAAMLCKVLPGWVLLVFVLEWLHLGPRDVWRSVRIYVVAAVCLAFAGLAYWTSLRSGLVEDASAGLFGDPLSRAALAVWIYARNITAPFWLTPWYLPDPNTHWLNPRVWVGLFLSSAALIHLVWACRQRKQGIALGWAWWWGLLLPVLGLVGAREAAAADRYLYQPLMGLLLVVGAGLGPWLTRLGGTRPRQTLRGLVAVCALLGVGELIWSLPHVPMYRSTIRRRALNVQRYPGDPRALEGLARAYEFAANHPLPKEDTARIPPGHSQYAYFLELALKTSLETVSVPNLEHYFPGVRDRAPFHRRMSYLFKVMRRYEESLAQAEIARRLDPDAYLTWVRLAHAYQGLGRVEQALAAYRRCEALLPDRPQTRAAHFTDFGYFLLTDMERPDLARAKFEQALATGCAPSLARVGLARCEIRAGQGARGYQIVTRVLDENPQDAMAGLVLAEYFLRSHKWERARNVYSTLAAAYPRVYQVFDWYYEALRGIQSVSAQLDEWEPAVAAWELALRIHPGRRELKSFYVWALACANRSEARQAADALLAEESNNPLACLSRALIATRTGAINEAVGWVDRAGQGRPVPHAQSLPRAAAVIKLQRERGQLGNDSQVVEAAIYLTGGRSELAQAALKEYLSSDPETRWRPLARRLLTRAEPGGQRPETAPGHPPPSQP